MTDPTSRALALLGLLQARPWWSGADLADRLGVTVRTVRRDVDRLRELGYTVDSDPGPAGGYTLGRGSVIPPLLLDEEQAVAVTVALTRAVMSGRGRQAEAALHALTTIDPVIPNPVRHRLSPLRDAAGTIPRVEAGAGPTSAPPDAEVLLACSDAVRRRVRVTFTYTDRHATTSVRTVEPHRLVATPRTWKLVAYDIDRSAWRAFRLDRMSAPTLGTWHFAPRPGLDAALAALEEPTPPEAWRHQVTVHIHAPHDVVTASLPHLAGHLQPLDDTTTQFRSGTDDPADAAWWLARVDHDFTVLGDQAVVTAVTTLASRLNHAVTTPLGPSEG